MAGNAKTNAFMLGTAEVMIGPVDKLYELNPITHGLGLVKDFTLEATKERSDLNQGRTNDIVFTMTTGAQTRCSMSMYEYTAENMAIALGLDGGSVIEVTGDALEVDTGTAFAAGTATLSLTDGSGLQQPSVGNYVSIRDPNTENIIMARIASVTGVTAGTASSASIDVTIADAASTLAVPLGSIVTVVNVLDIGSTDVDRDYSAKVSGQLADGTWITYLFPKVRITSGLTTAFTTGDFGNIPFEFTPLKVTAQDPFYNAFRGTSAKMLVDSVKSALA